MKYILALLISLTFLPNGKTEHRHSVEIYNYEWNTENHPNDLIKELKQEGLKVVELSDKDYKGHEDDILPAVILKKNDTIVKCWKSDLMYKVKVSKGEILKYIK